MRGSKGAKSIFQPTFIEKEPDPWEPMDINEFYKSNGHVDNLKKGR